MLSNFITNSTKDTITITNQQITQIGNHAVYSQITKLHLSNNNLKQLDGIESFSQLQNLSIANNKIESIAEFTKISKTLKYLSVTNNPFQTHLDYAYSLFEMFPNLEVLDNEKINRTLIREFKIKLETFGAVVLYYLNRNYVDLNFILSNRQINYQKKIIQIIEYLLKDYREQLNQMEENQIDQIYPIIFEHLIQFQKNNFNSNSIFQFFTNQALQLTDIDLKRFSEDDIYFKQMIYLAFQKYGQESFPTFPLNQEYNLGLLDFIYQQNISKQKTHRCREARIKLVKDSKDNNQNLNELKISQEQENNQVQNQEAFDSEVQERLNNYKKLYPIQKGLQKIINVLKQRYIHQIATQLNEYQVIQVIKFTKFYNKFLLFKLRIQRSNQQSAFRSIRKSATFIKVINLIQNRYFIQKAIEFKGLRCFIKSQIEQADLFRKQTLKIKAYGSLRDWKYRLGRQLKLTLLTHKVNSITRSALKDIRIMALQNKIYLRNYLDVDRRVAIRKKEERKSKSGFIHSEAVEQFKKYHFYVK